MKTSAATDSPVLSWIRGLSPKSVAELPTPALVVDATIDGLRKLNQMTHGTGLPKLNAQAIEALIHRDSLDILGLKMKGATI